MNLIFSFVISKVPCVLLKPYGLGVLFLAFLVLCLFFNLLIIGLWIAFQKDHCCNFHANNIFFLKNKRPRTIYSTHLFKECKNKNPTNEEKAFFNFTHKVLFEEV